MKSLAVTTSTIHSTNYFVGILDTVISTAEVRTFWKMTCKDKRAADPVQVKVRSCWSLEMWQMVKLLKQTEKWRVRSRSFARQQVSLTGCEVTWKAQQISGKSAKRDIFLSELTESWNAILQNCFYHLKNIWIALKKKKQRRIVIYVEHNFLLIVKITCFRSVFFQVVIPNLTFVSLVMYTIILNIIYQNEVHDLRGTMCSYISIKFREMQCCLEIIPHKSLPIFNYQQFISSWWTVKILKLLKIPCLNCYWETWRCYLPDF